MNRIQLYCLFLLSIIIGLSACRQEDDPENNLQKEVTFNLELPGCAPTTYAMPTDENKINTIDVLSFFVDPAFPNDVTKGTYNGRAFVSYTAGSTTFKTVLNMDVRNQTLVVLANARTAVNALSASIGNTKTSVMSQLTVSKPTGWDAASMTEIPMWGEIPNVKIDNSFASASVILVRMLSKINIVNAESRFVMKTAYLYNPKQKGAVSPDNWQTVGATVTTPTLPSGAAMPQATSFPYIPFTGASTDAIYMFESDNITQAAANPLNATCVVVGGSYNGISPDCYYRIDLKNYTNGTFYDILRNRSHTITVNQINTRGADTPDDAYRGLSTIRATVDIWNNAGGNVNFPGQNRLTVSQRSFTLSGDVNNAATLNNKVSIQTTDPAGWQIINVTGGSWLAANSLSGTPNSTTVVSVLTQANAGSCPRQGSFIIQSGNLQYKVDVVQQANTSCGDNGVAKAQMLGSKPYLTYRYGCSCWMVQNGMVYDSGYRMYGDDANKKNGFYYSSAHLAYILCPSGWHLPTVAEATALMNLANADKAGVGQWWTTSSGNAFAGYFDALVSASWKEWGTKGFWWMDSTPASARYFTSDNTGITVSPTTINSNMFSVRCVQN